jgi:phospholipid/cholesterol/gamma-HCH transport system substrate-binding protein
MAGLGRYRRIEIQVGLFSVLCLGVLVFGLLWLRDFRFAKRYSVYKVDFADTGGLVPGDIVMVSGFRKGSVRSMKLLERGVEVELAIEQDVQLRDDAVASIGTKGLLGERFVALDRGSEGAMLPPGGRLRGQLDYGMAELMSNAGELMDSARQASDDVQRVLETLANATQDAELRRGVRDASLSASRLRELLDGNHAALTSSIQSFQRAADNVARLTGNTEDDVVAVVRDLRAASGKLEALLARMDSTATRVDRVAVRVLESDGTVARMLDDPQLYDDLTRLLSRSDSLLTDIRVHPKRYFSFSIF